MGTPLGQQGSAGGYPQRGGAKGKAGGVLKLPSFSNPLNTSLPILGGRCLSVLESSSKSLFREGMGSALQRTVQEIPIR